MSGDLTGRNMTSPPAPSRVWSDNVELPTWSHTGLNLTNPHRSDYGRDWLSYVRRPNGSEHG